MYLSNSIEEFLNSLLNGESSGTIEIKRNELAEKLGCVPSQINYVIQTRFTKERGFSVESRRGGGGFIRITKVKIGADEYIMHIINSIGASLDFETARALIANLVDYNRISPREGKIILGAVSDSALPLPGDIRNKLRCNILKNILIKLL